jgi:predicted alpha-1,2-mannosidase
MIATLATPRAAQAGNADLVDPFIGTAAGAQPYAKGNTFPGALVPHGMVAVSPDTSPRYPGGYRSGARYIEGFSQNHMSGVGCAGDLGNILLAPTVGAVTTTEAGYRSTYGSEAASPGYYKVHLATPGVTAEMTATTRASVSRYTFPARPGGDANLLVDVSHGLTASRGGSVRVVSSSEVEGYNDAGGFCGTTSPYRVYFVARFGKPAAARGTWAGQTAGTAASRTGNDIGAYFRFKTAPGEAVTVRVGLSYVSVANARANLEAEIPASKSFEQVRAEALAKWNAELGKITVTGGSADQRKMFYTALYHALIHPSVNSDVNGQYPGMNGSGVRTARGYTHHHLFSLWDTYRSLHPLLTLAYPERQADMVRSMLAMYEESGWLPKWEFAAARRTRWWATRPRS